MVNLLKPLILGKPVSPEWITVGDTTVCSIARVAGFLLNTFFTTGALSHKLDSATRSAGGICGAMPASICRTGEVRRDSGGASAMRATARDTITSGFCSTGTEECPPGPVALKVNVA